MSNTTLFTGPQALQLLWLANQQKLSVEQMQSLFASGLFTLLLRSAKRGSIEDIDPFKFNDLLGDNRLNFIQYGQKISYPLERACGDLKAKARRLFDNPSFSLIGGEDEFQDNDGTLVSPRIFALRTMSFNMATETMALSHLQPANRGALLAVAHEAVEYPFQEGFIVSCGSIKDIEKPSRYWKFLALEIEKGKVSRFHLFRGDDIVYNGYNGDGVAVSKRHYFLAH